ncbi:MAG: HisA/HisF-related TIM barrel protein [Candidatus Micrarchaeia archaeon]|jgi:uncharacterized protein related to proFAR isomerase
MMKIPLIYVKDKQAFIKKGGVLKLVGKPSELVKKLKKDGVELVHIVDLDAINGSTTNFDVYDSLTFFMHIQVEGAKTEQMVKKLLEINARVVVPIPFPEAIHIEKFKDKKRLLVGKICEPEHSESTNETVFASVFDLLYCGNSEPDIRMLLKTKRRILVQGKVESKLASKLFGAIENFEG